MRKSGLAKTVLLALGLPGLAAAQFKYWDMRDSVDHTPLLLSQTGLYTGTTITAAKKTLQANAYHFEVNSALWSDGSHKTRWVMLKSGNSIQYSEKDDYWGYPDSAVFIKQFAIDTVPGDTTTRLLWETRFLINSKEIVDSASGKKADRWFGFSYKWNRDQKDAKVVDKNGLDDSIKVFPNGRNAAGIQKKWRFPARTECNSCHRVDFPDTVAKNHGRSVLGFFTAQLNRPHPDLPNQNQLENFFTRGILKGTKSVWNAPATPRWYGINDTAKAATVDLKARSYIAANCSGCHGYRGMGTNATFGVNLNYDFHAMESKVEYRHTSTAWDFTLNDSMPQFYPPSDTGNNPLRLDSIPIMSSLVVPGYPQKSVILYRQLVRRTEPGNYDPERNQMPPSATFEVNVAATNLLARWITEMPKLKAPNAVVGIRAWLSRTQLKGPGIQGNHVVLPADLAGPGSVRVSLTGINGRTLELNQLSRTTYALPAQLTPGVYIIRVNKKSFTRYLF